MQRILRAKQLIGKLLAIVLVGLSALRTQA